MSRERGWKSHWSRKIRVLGNVGKAGREQQRTLELVLRDQQLFPKGNVCSSSSANSPVAETRRFSARQLKQGFGGADSL